MKKMQLFLIALLVSLHGGSALAESGDDYSQLGEDYSNPNLMPGSDDYRADRDDLDDAMLPSELSEMGMSEDSDADDSAEVQDGLGQGFADHVNGDSDSIVDSDMQLIPDDSSVSEDTDADVDAENNEIDVDDSASDDEAEAEASSILESEAFADEDESRSEPDSE